MKCEEEPTQKAVKLDEGKQPYHAMPLVVLKPLADVYEAGVKSNIKIVIYLELESGTLVIS
jgi:hypothetical protein